MSSFLAEIREQPAALRRLLDSLPAELEAVTPFDDQLRQGNFRTVIFTGMGSSLSACVPATIILARHGIPALLIEASELLAAYLPLLNAQTLVVMISQSGRSAEIVRLLDEVDPKVPIIGVTNTASSPLGERSAVRLMMQAGAEATVSSKTYTCSLALLHLLALKLTNQASVHAFTEVQAVADQLADIIPRFEERAAEISRQIVPVKFIEFLGRGASRASAITAALITKETVKMPTEGMAGGQFRHGPWELLEPGITVCLFSGSPATNSLDQALATDIIARGATAIVIGSTSQTGALHVPVPQNDPLLSPILEIVPVQLLAAELASARGFTPGEFRYSGKITTIE